MTVMRDYWAGSSAERRAMRKADPRIDQYYDTRDKYAEMFPLWAKYYTEQGGASGSAGGSSGQSNRYYSGGGGRSYYRRSYSGGGYSGGGGIEMDYTLPLGYRTSMEASQAMARAGQGQYGGTIRFPTAVWKALSSVTKTEVESGEPVSNQARDELMKVAKKFPKSKPAVESVLNRGRPYEQDYPIDLGW